jgi:uncharacterized protein
MTHLIRRALIVTALAVTASIAAFQSPAMAQDSAEEVRNKTLVEAGMQAWRDRTGSPYDLLADDVSWTIQGNSLASKTYESREAFMSEVIRPFNARMATPLSPSVRRIYADGDTVVVFFDAAGQARDGQIYANTYAWILRLADGRIVEAHAFFDAIAFDDLWRRVPAS